MYLYLFSMTFARKHCKVYSLYSQFLLPSLHYKYRFDTQSTHRVAMATFWRTFNHDGKISPACWRWGLPRPSPFTLSTISKQSCGVRSGWEGRYTPPISPLPLYVLCGSTPRSPSVQLKGQWDFWQKNYILKQLFHRPQICFRHPEFLEVAEIFKRFGGTMLLLLLIYYLRHTEIHSFIHP